LFVCLCSLSMLQMSWETAPVTCKCGAGSQARLRRSYEALTSCKLPMPSDLRLACTAMGS